MYCKNCGSQINDNANVCGYCGTPVHTQNGFSNNQQQNNTVSGQQVYGEPTPSYSGSTQNSNYQNSGQIKIRDMELHNHRIWMVDRQDLQLRL